MVRLCDVTYVRRWRHGVSMEAAELAAVADVGVGAVDTDGRCTRGVREQTAH